MSRRTARTARPSEQGTTQTKTPARPQRYSLVYADSPLASPSLSATRPFDWDAARGLKPPPYQTPSIPRNNRVRQSIAVGPDAHGSPSPTNLHEAGKKPRKSRVMVKTSWGKWLSSIPSQWLLRLSMLQHELPLPQPRTIGNSVGLCLHLLHALVRWLDISQMRAEEDIWMDPRGEFVFEDEDEEESGAWIQWVSLESSFHLTMLICNSKATLLTVLLFTISIINSLFLFTRTKTYDFQLRGSESKPVPSQNASYITSPIRRAKEQESFPKDPTLGRYLHQIAMLTGRWIAHAWQVIDFSNRTTTHLNTGIFLSITQAKMLHLLSVLLSAFNN